MDVEGRDPPAAAHDEEALFDAYSALARSGSAPPPVEFLAATPAASADLRLALERIFKRAPRAATAAGELPFARLGDFRLVKRLGGGGMGIVYLAVQESLGREVALKILRPELQGSAVAAERFRREARALADLRHDSLVAVFGGGEEHGVRYLAMELVPGVSLDEHLAAEPGPPRGGNVARRVRWVEGVARGLQHAHERGVVHRDVKPANLRITPDDRARLLDFGLARRAATKGATLTESFAGSPSYAAPEQIREEGAIDARTDVYALGVTLYECLTGRLPFTGATVEQLFHRILTAIPEPPRRHAPTLPRDLEVVVLKAMERRPEQRYSSAAEFADDLMAVLELRPIRGRPPSALERARRLVQRHPLIATFCCTAVAALLFLLALLATQREARERSRRDEARRVLDSARARVTEYRTQRESLAAVQKEVALLQAQGESQFFDADQRRLLDRYEERLDGERRRWEAAYYEVLDLVGQAERLDPALVDADLVRGELFFARYRETLDANDPRGAELFRDLAAKHDPALARALQSEAKLELTSDPPGAEVYAFRLDDLSDLEPEGEPRIVAAPLDATAPLSPGTWCLRLVEDAPPLQRDDLVFTLAGQPIEGALFVLADTASLAAGTRFVAVDEMPMRDDWDVQQLPRVAPADTPHRFEFLEAGEKKTLIGQSLAELGIEVGGARRLARCAARDAIPCSVIRNGQRLEALLPPAAPAEATARPLFLSPKSRLGTTPLSTRLPRGEYLLAIRAPGRAPAHLARRFDETSNPVTVELPPAGQAPPGYVWIADGDDACRRGFWIAMHELTSGEWRDFLDDEAQRAPLGSAEGLRLVPRANRTTPYWPQDASGRFSWPAPWNADWPVVGISWNDARDYIAWRNVNRPPPDPAFEWAMPTLAQHVRASLGHLGWRFVYGQRLRPYYSRCCFARPHANLGAVLEFPVDESVLQVFDLTGGTYEWLDHWYDEPRGLRMVAGGAWGQARADHLSVAGGMGIEPHVMSGETGLRLVLRRKGVEVPR